MGSFAEQTEIAAPRERVWQVLAEIGSIDRWNPGVKRSYATSSEPDGEGATRHCDLQRANGKPAGHLEERAFDWHDREGFRIEITESSLPFKSAVISFSLADTAGGTRVTVSPDYALRYGPLGKLLDVTVVRGQYEKGIRAMLDGLKTYVETDEQS